MSNHTAAADWKVVQTLPEAHTRTVYSVDWSPFGPVASGAGDDSIAVYVARGPGHEEKQQNSEAEVVDRLVAVVMQEAAHNGDVNCVAWHPTVPGLLASCGDDATVRLWRFTE